MALASQLGGFLGGRLSSLLPEWGTFQGGAQIVVGPHLPTRALSLTFTPQPLWSHRVSCGGRGQGEGVEASLLTPQTGPTHSPRRWSPGSLRVLGPVVPPLASYGPGAPRPRLGLTFLHFAKSTHFPAPNCAADSPRLLFPLLILFTLLFLLGRFSRV